MTIFIFDSNGYVGFLSNLGWLNILSDALSPTSKICEHFFADGCTEDLEELKKALDNITSSNQALQELIEDLRMLLDKCEDIAILCDGWVEDTDGE